MSTTYRTETPVSWDNFFSRLPENIRIDETADNGPCQRCLTDGSNHLWVSTDDFKNIILVRYGANFVDDMIATLEDTLDMEIYSEHHPNYWCE